jgi:hypothetical protein
MSMAESLLDHASHIHRREFKTSVQKNSPIQAFAEIEALVLTKEWQGTG